MPPVRISSKFQVVLPKSVRQAMQLKPGQLLHVFTSGDRVEMVPVEDLQSMRGFLGGIDTSVPRDKDRA